MDQLLIQRAANGDATAFSAIVEQHQGMVYRVCLRLLRNEADAEDAAQATFIVLHKKCSTLKPGTVLGGWLYRTAELVCREHIRSSARRKRREEQVSAMKERTVPENTEMWKTLQPELDLAIISLPPKYRDVVILRYLEGKTTNETAMAVGLTDSAVTTRLARALEQLQAYFQRRKIAIGTSVLAVVLSENAASAAVPTSLAPTILSATTGGAVVTNSSAQVALMANGALMKMGSVFGILFDALMAVAWISSMICWVRDGCPIPRWVHLMALCLFGAGVVSSVIMVVMGMLTLEIAAICIVSPPAAAYIGWLWMIGPVHAKGSQ